VNVLFDQQYADTTPGGLHEHVQHAIDDVRCQAE